MGGEDEGSRIAAKHDRRSGRQGNRPARKPLHRCGRPFAVAFAKLQSTGIQLRWRSQMDADPARKAKKACKTKFTCPECAQNAWAKPDALLICGACYEDDEGNIHLMLAEPQQEDEAA